jgi:hypothetical protein
MRRLPSTLTLASWMGFLAVSAAMRIDGASAALAQAADASLEMDFTSSFIHISHLVLPGLVLLVLAFVPGTALYFLNEARIDRRHLGEGIGCGALALVALLALVPGTAIFNVDTDSAGFWALLLCSVLAIGFDRLVTDEAPDDEEEFRAGIAFIAHAMARQTHLHAGPGPQNSKAPMR